MDELQRPDRDAGVVERPNHARGSRRPPRRPRPARFFASIGGSSLPIRPQTRSASAIEPSSSWSRMCGLPIARLERVRRALGDDPPAVDDADVVGELVGLLQVLGGEEDGRAVVVERAHLLPDRLAADRDRGPWSARRGRGRGARGRGRPRGRAGAACRPSSHPPGGPPPRRGRPARAASSARRRPSAVGIPWRVACSRISSRPGHQRVERRFLKGDADRAGAPVALRRRHRGRRPSPVLRSAAAASSASARWSSCRPRWGRGSRRSRPRRPRCRFRCTAMHLVEGALQPLDRDRIAGHAHASVGSRRAAAGRRPSAGRLPAPAPRRRRAASRRRPRRPAAAGRAAARRR